MNGPSEFQVAAEANREIAESAELPLYREKIGESLRRVVMSAVTRIYHGNLAVH